MSTPKIFKLFDSWISLTCFLNILFSRGEYVIGKIWKFQIFDSWISLISFLNILFGKGELVISKIRKSGITCEENLRLGWSVDDYVSHDLILSNPLLVPSSTHGYFMESNAIQLKHSVLFF